MAELLNITEPADKRGLLPSWQSFLELGFRPLYLAGTAWALLSVALWVWAPAYLQGVLPGVFWHMHEMLWGFVATIAVGFLLTAGANWTGINPMSGLPLAVLLLLWLLARAGFLLPGSTAFVLAAGAELLFFAGAALALGRSICTAGSRRNYGVPLLLLGLGVADALFLYAVKAGDYAQLLPRFYSGMLCMAVIALLIARRVTPFFAMRAVPGLDIPMHTQSGHWQLGAGVLAIVFLLAGWRQGQAAALLVAGVLALWQLLSWRPWAVRRVPLLWILYVGYAALGAGLVVAAMEAAGVAMRPAWPVHVIGAGGFAVLIIGMVTRTALGHLGRPLQTDALMVTMYVLVIAAAILRLLALWPSPFTVHVLHGSALLWVLAFALYLWRFAPWMIRPRIDRLPATGTRLPKAAGKP